MSIPKNDKELHACRQKAISKLDNFLSCLISGGDPKIPHNDSTKKKADLLSYWINDYTKMLIQEFSFNPSNTKKYKRGEIIKAHFGFRIGSEEGGLHYAVVIEKDNPRSSDTVTVIPLTSVKNNTDVTKLRYGQVYLGNELYSSLRLKVGTLLKEAKDQLDTLMKLNPTDQTTKEQIDNETDVLEKDIAFLVKASKELNRMKKGSIALTGQITTISKIRIYDPKSSKDVLAGVKLSAESMDKIDASILAKYTKTNELSIFA